MKTAIRNAYVSGTHPISYSGRTNIRRYFPAASDQIIDEALGGIDTYTLFREEKRPRHYNPIYVRRARDLIQADLIDLSGLAESNDGIKFLLVVIDSFTRYAWIKALQNKTGPTVLNAFRQILLGMGQQPSRLMCDQGKEFENAAFRNYLNERNIQFVIPNNKAPHVERFNRSFQNLLYRYMEENETKRYIDAMPTLLTVYNKRIHRMIKMSPSRAELPANHAQVLQHLEAYYRKAVGRNLDPRNPNDVNELLEGRKVRTPPRFKIGDLVRISSHKETFHKGYYQTFLPTLYKIARIITHLPVTMYKIRNVQTNRMESGTWYKEELTKVDPNHTNDQLFKVTVLKRRNIGAEPEVFVKWNYWPDSYNEWIPESQLVDLAQA